MQMQQLESLQSYQGAELLSAHPATPTKAIQNGSLYVSVALRCVLGSCLRSQFCVVRVLCVCSHLYLFFQRALNLPAEIKLNRRRAAFQDDDGELFPLAGNILYYN